MRNIVHAIDYQSFNDGVSKRNITDDTVYNWKNQAFIEIQGEQDLLHPDCQFWFKKNHPNVLRLAFDDVEEDIQYEDLSEKSIGLQCKVITDQQAKELVEFINNHKESAFIIHCHAGVSRSGAVAQFVCEIKDISLTEFHIMNPYAYPNQAVLRKLRAANN